MRGRAHSEEKLRTQLDPAPAPGALPDSGSASFLGGLFLATLKWPDNSTVSSLGEPGGSLGLLGSIAPAGLASVLANPSDKVTALPSVWGQLG